MYQTPSNGMKLGNRIQLHKIGQQRSSVKFQNVCVKNTGTQTINDKSCKDHSRQITELLTEVAITLGYKAKLENELSELKENNEKMLIQWNDLRIKLEQEIEKLKNENFEKDMLLSNVKILHLEEQKSLLTQVSELKSEIQNLTQQNQLTCQDLKNEKDQLEKKIDINKDDLKKETEKNVNLQIKITKYRNKFKNMVIYIQNLVQEFKDKQNKSEIQSEKKNSVTENTEIPNLEELILTELFFKPSTLPIEIAELFFQQT